MRSLSQMDSCLIGNHMWALNIAPLWVRLWLHCYKARLIWELKRSLQDSELQRRWIVHLRAHCRDIRRIIIDWRVRLAQERWWRAILKDCIMISWIRSGSKESWRKKESRIQCVKPVLNSPLLYLIKRWLKRCWIECTVLSNSLEVCHRSLSCQPWRS